MGNGPHHSPEPWYPQSRVILLALFVDEHTKPQFDCGRGIKKSKIAIKPYWQLNQKSLEIMGISREDDDPIQPFERTPNDLFKRRT
ncbi:MAG TPA: hypothetical protein PLN05_04440 [Pyrinomonadaceae bacterium]|nr:hypothetical protein [Chloracidobacterium sp.]HRJ89729.1 hypothetical protein [Pyrinomonadaceae bacterium]HRK49658.1 hypothetical protein [Pyrinomonadaceae bacterium]